MRPLRSALPVLTAASLLLVGACTSDGSDGATTTTRPASSTTVDGDRTTTSTDEGGDDTTTTDPDDGTTTTEPDSGGGGEPIDADGQAYVDAFATGWEDLAEIGAPITTDQATCIAEGFVGTIGADRLAAAGVTPEAFAEATGTLPDGLDIDEDTANDLYDVFGDCDLDLAEFYGTAEAETLSPEEKACIDAIVTDDNLRRSVVADLMGEELTDDPLDQAFSCIEGYDELTTTTIG